MNTKKLNSITIRVDAEVYASIEEIKWQEKKTQSQLLRELLNLGLKSKLEKEGI